MRSTWYTVANATWQAVKWVWAAIIIVIVVSVASSVFAGKQAEIVNTTAVTFIRWLSTLSFYPILTLSLLGLFIVITLASGLTTFVLGKIYGAAAYAPPPEVQAILDYIKKDVEATQQREEVQQALDRAAFTQYLRSIEEMCETISPRGFAQLWRTLILADVPLNEPFVPLHVVSDEPIYDAPGEQQKQLEAMRKRTDLSIEERDAYLQGLRFIWQSQLRWNVDEEQAQQPLLFEEILPRLTSTSPVAILLGAPGSGKTTFLRWLAFHMARATLSPSTYSLPNGLGRPQIPLLIETNEYAGRLEKDYLTLKQFLIVQWSNIHPNLPVKLLDELAQGRCLILIDGLDQGATVNVRRRVIAAIHEFIADYASDDPSNYNRFIIASRTADREPGAFARYMHYTLLDLDEQLVDQMLAQWCLAIEHYRAMAIKGMQSLTSSEEAEARTAGAKQQAQLSQMLKSNPSLMQLATNPMALTMMVLLQVSGRDLLQHRIELCQMLTCTLLDTWNRESGRKMFSGAEMPLAEQLLSSLAFRLYESSTPLTGFDVAMTTRQTLAAFQQREPAEIREEDVMQFIETLRRSSGLFAEGGEDLFYFANRTLQDYYVVRYLLHMPQEELKQFAFQHSHAARWRELLLLALRYNSRQNLLTVRSRQHEESARAKSLPPPPLPQATPEERAMAIQALQQVHQLSILQIEGLLAACVDTRPLPEETQQALGVSTVQAMAWKVLRQPLLLEQEALNAVLSALESSQPPLCEGAAMLLQQSKTLPQEIQQRATQKIWQMLIDNNVQHRFAPAGSYELLRLYDTLFETLRVLAEAS
jgi:hypothetical protein